MSSFPGWYLSVRFPPIVFGLTYQGEGFRQQLLQCCSALCTRFQLFRQGTCQGGKRMPWNGMGNSRKLGILAKQKNSWILFGVFFQQNADHTTDVPAGFCGSYESWLVFFFFPFFFLLLVFKVGFSQTRNSQCQTANPKKNTLILRIPNEVHRRILLSFAPPKHWWPRWGHMVTVDLLLPGRKIWHSWNFI